MEFLKKSKITQDNPKNTDNWTLKMLFLWYLLFFRDGDDVLSGLKIPLKIYLYE